MNRVWGWLVVGLAVSGLGCFDSKDQVQRSQIGEDPIPDADAFATVGMKTLPDNMGPVTVSGVGLVYRLQPGTGSTPAQDGWRQMLEHALKKQGFTNLKDLLDDPNRTTSLVLVSALIPPGARKGEAIDVQIALPDDSKTTSLQGGVLLTCDLVDYDTTANLRNQVQSNRPTATDNTLLLGNVWAKAEGPVMAGAYVPVGRRDPTIAERKSGSAEGVPEPLILKAGRIWGGGRVTRPRPYLFLMKPGDQNIRMAVEVSERLNATFHGTADTNRKVAEAKTREHVVVSVPHSYRHDHLRFLLVSRQVPMVPVGPDSLYRRKLEDELLDPATTLTAAIKLEALGGESRRALWVGLESPSPWVRFASAEALAYLGHTDGASELAKLAEDHPALRSQCLKALAATDDAACTDRLVDLLAAADPVLRYGAFIALRLADENHSAIRGELLAKTYWVHRVAPGSPGLVHLAADRRSEVVVFGDGVKFRGPFTLPVGSEFTVSMPANGTQVKITRIVTVRGEPEVKEVTGPADLGAVLATMAQLRGGYGEAVELIRKADGAQVLTAALAIDALPRQFSVQQLAGFARIDPALVKANVEVARVGTRQTDPETAGVDLPAGPEDSKPAEVVPVRAPLSREPGRIFGPKPRPEVPVAEPLTPVVPAGGAEPSDAKDLGRNPGTLFPRK